MKWEMGNGMKNIPFFYAPEKMHKKNLSRKFKKKDENLE